MGKAVFTTKPGPSYDDVPEEFYHFPRTYLRAVERTVGDAILYYEPRRGSADLSSRGGRQAYFAMAAVKDVAPDRKADGMSYALIDSPTYLSFDTPVPFRGPGGPARLGRRGAGARPLRPADGGADRPAPLQGHSLPARRSPGL